MRNTSRKSPVSVGIVGMGAFGELIAEHIADDFDVWAYDPRLPIGTERRGVLSTTLERIASRDVVVIATPVSSFETVLRDLARACKPGALIVDVGSVKVAPAKLMLQLLPQTVHIVATHPLFGPQSARGGLAGLKIAICPLRGADHRPLVRFLSRGLGLEVILTTPEAHDREVAVVQGLTHLIAKVLLEMGPLPSRMTTRSFDLLVEAISMVKNDAPEVFEAIERANPYSAGVRQCFVDAVRQANERLQSPVTDGRRQHTIGGASDVAMAYQGVGR